MEPDQIHITQEEVFGMSVSIALKTLNEIMMDENTSVDNKIWAAETVLENNPKEVSTSSDGVKKEKDLNE